MKTRTMLTYLLLSIQSILLAQSNNKFNTNISFGHAPDCVGYSGICAFTATQNKMNANTEVSFDSTNKELTLTINKENLSADNKLKILREKLEKDIFLYTIDTDFVLPNETKTTLNIKKCTKIKQGIYLVRVIDDSITIKLKLE